MNNPVSASDLEAALDALLMVDAPPQLEDTDLTAGRLAIRAKCGHPKAVRLLERWTEEGKAEFLGERRDSHGHRVRAWRLVTK